MKDLIKLPLTLAIVAIVCTIIITATYQITNPVLQDRLDAEREELFSTMYGQDLDGYEIIAEDVSEDNPTIYSVSLKDGTTQTVFDMQEIGKNGTLNVFVAYDSEGNITQLEYLNFQETPGIGSKVAEDSYVNTIVGQNSSSVEVDTISGATISSSGVRQAVENSSQTFNEGGY